MNKQKLADTKKALHHKNPSEVLEWALKEFGAGKVALASSVGAEDQVLTHMLAGINPKARIFTLDTGRLFQETHDTMQKSMEKYGITYETLSPDAHEVAALTREKGPNLFYLSVENRKACCDVRKQRPLKNFFEGLDAWICGLWSQQAATRQAVDVISWDEQNGLFKICPLHDWNEEKVWAFIKEKGVPYNPLHDQRFRSIGCAPCTRAVKPGEDIRAGRWWWESPEQKECGLHLPGQKPNPTKS